MQDDHDVFSFFGITNEKALEETLGRHVNQNATNLGFTQNLPYGKAFSLPFITASSSNIQVTPKAVEISSTPSRSQVLRTSSLSNVPESDSKEALTKAQLREVFSKAFPQAALRKWRDMPNWTDNPALDAIVYWESGRNPNDQNPKSTAYGLFQFLNDTWEDTGVKKSRDPVVQAIGGMRYIYSRYETPENALGFQRGTTLRKPELIPLKYRELGMKWIRNGWQGY
jgi:hypothetical protein